MKNASVCVDYRPWNSVELDVSPSKGTSPSKERHFLARIWGEGKGLDSRDC